MKCTINGVELEVKEGSTIIEAMSQAGQKIAHYCWHPGLKIAGVCRLCMVEVEGNPRLQIACNTTVSEGMKVNNTSEKVKDAVKWGLDFHLINHPLDCPICDQAGECGLQEQYMEYGKYDPEMCESKQKKHKVVDLGPTVVLDSERCILCSRCVRFTSDVSKTDELGIFNRGDRSEIGTHDGKALDNKYSLNTVDICPVGALTSKDFRFKQRVWYLKDAQTVCNGCSTGCNVKVYFNKEGMFRVKPVYNMQVNGYWMCDDGRNIYKFVNKEARLLKGQSYEHGVLKSETVAGAKAVEVGNTLKQISKDQVALVITGQYTVEEYEATIKSFIDKWGNKNIYHWINNKESFDTFDGLLIRGDKNPNTKGLLKVLEKYGVQSKWSELESALSAGSISHLIVAGPENQAVFPDLKAKMELFAHSKNIIWLTAGLLPNLEALNSVNSLSLIPLKTFVEKSGTFINVNGLEQKFKVATTVVSEALTLNEAFRLLAGDTLVIETQDVDTFVESQRSVSQVMLEKRKKNEFVFKRGTL